MMLPFHLVGLLVSPSAAVPQTGPPPGYYDTVDDTDAAILRATLHPVIDDHTRFPYTSSATDTWDILELADEDPNNAGNILDVYRNATYPKQGGGNSFYQREHTWPNSYGFPNDGSSNYPFTDCHQLFLCDGSYNGSRSNKPFRNCSAGCDEYPTDFNDGRGGGTGVYPGNSNWSTGNFTSGTWEVWGGRRGDVARAIFYMDIRYEGGIHGITGVMEPDLVVTDDLLLIGASNTGSNESVAYMGLKSVLLEWHLEDPVDANEMARNDAVACFQGNRNPFVDNPQWVAVLYDDGPPVTTAGDPFINEFHYDNAGADTGEFIEVAGPAGLDLAGWTLVGYNGNGGGTYDTELLGGVLPDQGGCMGTLAFPFTGLQNGSPDGMALVDPVGNVVQFLSYEGSFTATDGPAVGMVSTDVGVSEISSTPIGTSLQLGGTGGSPASLSWQPSQTETPGSPNVNQTLTGGALAAVATRNGGTNPASYTAAPLVIGASFDATVDNNAAGQTQSVLFALDSAISLTLSGGQTVLCLDVGAGELFTGAGLLPSSSAGGVDTYSLAVPNDPLLCGLELYTQSIQFGSPPFVLSNAQDLTAGY